MGPLSLDCLSADTSTWLETFNVDQSNLDTLYALMVEQAVSTTDWNASKPLRRPTGGRTELLRVTAGGLGYSVPYWGAGSVRDVYSSIQALVPDAVWEKLFARRDAFHKSN